MLSIVLRTLGLDLLPLLDLTAALVFPGVLGLGP